MSLPIKLISTDFDGTLHSGFENPPVPQNVQHLLAQLQAQGAFWVINTGRDLASLNEGMVNSGLSIRPDYVVVVEREIYRRQESDYIGVEDWNNGCTEAHTGLFARVRADLPRIAEWIHSRFKATVYEDPYSPFCLIAENNRDADVIHDYLSTYCQDITNLTVVRNDIYARFSHKAYNKGTALAEIAKRLGIDRNFIFAAGDHFNDLPMLSSEFARWLVAPGNAIDEGKELVLQQNGFVGRGSHGHGVAEGLEFGLAQTRRSFA